MAQNTNPIFTLVPNVTQSIWTQNQTGNVKSDGTGTVGTNLVVAFTAGSNGSFLQKIRASPAAALAATATTGTVLRVFLSSANAGSITTGSISQLAEMACPAQTACQTTVAVTPVEIPLGMLVPSGSFILVSMHAAAAANTSWQFIAIGGDY